MPFKRLIADLLLRSERSTGRSGAAIALTPLGNQPQVKRWSCLRSRAAPGELTRGRCGNDGLPPPALTAIGLDLPPEVHRLVVHVVSQTSAGRQRFRPRFRSSTQDSIQLGFRKL